MATLFTHALVAAALVKAASPAQPPAARPGRDWLPALAVLSSVLPDLDVVGFAFGVRYGDFLGHRGFTHSLAFAALWSAAAWGALSSAERASGAFRAPRSALALRWLLLFLPTASHGLLDALTDGGLGVAFLSPWDKTRYFFPWQPLHVSPIGAGFFSARAWSVLWSEARWAWLPTTALSMLWAVVRRMGGPRQPGYESGKN